LSANQAFFLALHLGTVVLIIAAHAARGRLSLGPVLALGGLQTFLIWQIAQAAWWVEWGDLRINAAHLGVMPALLVGGLIIYTMDGVKAGRTYIAVVAGTTALATLYLEFLARLSDVVPLPSYVFLSFYGQLMLALSLVAGLVGAMVVCELVRRFAHWLAGLVTGLLVGQLTILVVQSLTSYGLPLAFVNIQNEVTEFALAALVPGLLLAGYGVVAGHFRWILPARPVSRLFAAWRATEEEIREARETALEAKHTISELQDLNRQLEREKRLREHQVANSPLAVIEVDGEGRITEFNRAAEVLLGDASNIVAGARLDRVMPGFESFLNDPHRVSDLLTLPRGASGPRMIDVTVMPFEDQGRLEGFSVLLEDVTERERARLQRQIMGRMRGVQMAGRVVAHDFANLVTAIEGNVAGIRATMGSELPEAVERSLQAIRQAVARARSMLDQLGGQQPFAEPRLEPCRLDRLVDEAVRIEQPTADSKGLVLAVEDVPDVWVEVDSTQIIRVLLNLLRNAAEATPAAGRIVVRGRAQPDTVTVEVADTGRGMSRDQIAQAFQPGFSTKGGGEGGIGLAVSYMIVDAHGGQLDIRSPGEGGTAVALTLNRAGQGEASGDRLSPDGPSYRPLQGHRVLLAMADPQRRDPVVHTLFRAGAADVAEVETAEEFAAVLADEDAWDTLATDGSIPGLAASAMWQLDLSNASTDPADLAARIRAEAARFGRRSVTRHASGPDAC
jgi:signal transduction histidine kinase